MVHPRQRDYKKTSGGYIKGIAIDAVLTDEAKKAVFQMKQARKEEHKKVLFDFIEFFSVEMQKKYPSAAQMVEKFLFDVWKQNGIIKELPQANIQIENLLNDSAMYDAIDIAKAIYQNFKETRLKK